MRLPERLVVYRNKPGLSLAAIATMAYAGTLVGPPVIGQLSEILSLRGALVLVVLLCLTIALLAQTLRPAQSSEPEKEEGKRRTLSSEGVWGE